MTRQAVAAESDVQSSAWTAEHAAAWLMVLVALALGTIGLLRGFAVIGPEPAAGEVGAAGTQAPGFGAIWDGALWLLSAIAAAFLAMTLHTTEHHRLRTPEQIATGDTGMWRAEHALAYLLALATLAGGALGLLTGFDVFDRGSDQPDGLLWLLASIGCGVLAYTLHAVRHHQLAADEDYIARMVERRVSMPDRTTVGTTEPVRETRQ